MNRKTAGRISAMAMASMMMMSVCVVNAAAEGKLNRSHS